MDPDPINKTGVPVSYVPGYDFPRIVAFSGKFGTGKDSGATCVLEYLATNYAVLNANGTFEPPLVDHLKFADALKRSSSEMTGVALVDQYRADGKAKEIPGLDMSVGRFQQLLGTVARQQIHPDIWMLPVLNQTRSSGKFTVISDCRFRNEAIGIQKMGGLVIRLNRHPDLISEESKAGRDPNHISETDLDDYPNFDLVIQNDSFDHHYLLTILAFLSTMKNRSDGIIKAHHERASEILARLPKEGP